ncbi:MAG TPA: NAD(P)-binding domain-containing protein, partial [Verrucomicrobiae bacterium]|nr:NAD(P)-binding domain-containing protein [Verrucomicrobiae bacterium]
MTQQNWFKHTLMIIVALAVSFGTFPNGALAQSATNSSPMKIGIIGSGNIGSTVGTLWVKAGHQVMFSSRHPENLKQLVDGLGSLARAGTVEEAFSFGDVVFIGVPYGAYPQLGKDYAKQFAGKIVLDAGNAVLARDGEIAKPARENGVALTSAKLLAGARIVRAFNIMGSSKVASFSNRPEPRIAMPIAGDDPQALKVAARLVRDAGFDPVEVGELQRSK